MKNKYRVIRKTGKGAILFGAKKNIISRIFKEIGKITVNLGYLTFTSLVLGNIIKGDYERLSLIWIGSGVTVLLIVAGIIMLAAGGE